MANLFLQQAKHYAAARPTYPDQLFKFIASKTPSHHLAWDVGTGNGQAAAALAKLYERVVATDTSPKQLELAAKRPNIRYQCTPPKLSMAELEQSIASESSVDLVTVAQALHWFDFPTFYRQVKWILKKPNGVIAAWCYSVPEINPAIDAVFERFYAVDSKPFWEPERKLIDDKYETIDFPFEAVDGLEQTGPFEFKAERVMDLDGFFTYIRSWSAYQTAKHKGVELLNDGVVKDFTCAWNEDGASEKVVSCPIYLRIGKVGTC